MYTEVALCKPLCLCVCKDDKWKHKYRKCINRKTAECSSNEMLKERESQKRNERAFGFLRVHIRAQDERVGVRFAGSFEILWSKYAFVQATLSTSNELFMYQVVKTHSWKMQTSTNLNRRFLKSVLPCSVCWSSKTWFINFVLSSISPERQTRNKLTPDKPDTTFGQKLFTRTVYIAVHGDKLVLLFSIQGCRSTVHWERNSKSEQHEADTTQTAGLYRLARQWSMQSLCRFNHLC